MRGCINVLLILCFCFCSVYLVLINTKFFKFTSTIYSFFSKKLKYEHLYKRVKSVSINILSKN